MKTPEVYVDRSILVGAKRYLKAPIDNLQHALVFADLNPESFHTRIDEFDQTCEALAETVSNPRMSRSDYFNVLKLKTELGKGAIVPTLSQIINSKNKFPLQTAIKTLRETNGFISSGKWTFPKETDNPNGLISRLLIETYALFLKRLYEIPRFSSQTFTLAFREVLWNKFQRSALLNDVLPWMQEEKNLFAYQVQQGLEHTVQVQNNEKPGVTAIPKVFRDFLAKELGFQ